MINKRNDWTHAANALKFTRKTAHMSVQDAAKLTGINERKIINTEHHNAEKGLTVGEIDELISRIVAASTNNSCTEDKTMCNNINKTELFIQDITGKKLTGIAISQADIETISFDKLYYHVFSEICYRLNLDMSKYVYIPEMPNDPKINDIVNGSTNVYNMLDNLLKYRNIRQVDLGEKIGCCGGNVSAMIRKEFNITVDRMERIMKAVSFPLIKYWSYGDHSTFPIDNPKKIVDMGEGGLVYTCECGRIASTFKGEYTCAHCESANTYFNGRNYAGVDDLYAPLKLKQDMPTLKDDASYDTIKEQLQTECLTYDEANNAMKDLVNAPDDNDNDNTDSDTVVDTYDSSCIPEDPGCIHDQITELASVVGRDCDVAKIKLLLVTIYNMSRASVDYDFNWSINTK